MKYTVIKNKQPVLHTDDLSEAREKLRGLGDGSFIQYNEKAIKEENDERQI